ncbi:GRAM domain-containing protein 4 [Pteropus vampyrus]|uniref:GRAM domain-containing protein 4 n=1 Tax=Pteropus vampyrus TaxID=132908 RepID=A0A6P6BX32_PTEVA|nr:GRAM domain-containing protein 4 [Pteropus vampyrus]
MLRRLDRIRFRGHRRDDFLDLAESPNASDTECGDEGPLRTPRTSPRDSEELRDPAGPGTLIMAAGVQDLNRTEFDRLNEIKGHLEIALLEKHFLHVAWRTPAPDHDDYIVTCVLSRGRGSLQACRVVGTVTGPPRTCRMAAGGGGLTQAPVGWELPGQCLCWGQPQASGSQCEGHQGPPCGLRGLELLLGGSGSVFGGPSPPQPGPHLGASSPHPLQALQAPPSLMPAVSADRRGQGLCPRVQKWFFEKFGEYVEDFRFQPEESAVETEEPLSARRLTENMRRLSEYRALGGLTSAWGPRAGVRRMQATHLPVDSRGQQQVATAPQALACGTAPGRAGTPARRALSAPGPRPSPRQPVCPTTSRGAPPSRPHGQLLCFPRRKPAGQGGVRSASSCRWAPHRVPTAPSCPQVYVNAVWHGWAIPMFLFLAILRLSLNYLIARGWRIQWSIVPEVSEVVEPPKEDLTVSEKFQLVLDVAQKAQNLFGKMADILEKIKNLFMWVQPEITQKLYVALWAAFLASCFFPYRLVGLALGKAPLGRCGRAGAAGPLLPTGCLRHRRLQGGGRLFTLTAFLPLRLGQWFLSKRLNWGEMKVRAERAEGWASGAVAVLRGVAGLRLHLQPAGPASRGPAFSFVLVPRVSVVSFLTSCQGMTRYGVRGEAPPPAVTQCCVLPCCDCAVTVTCVLLLVACRGPALILARLSELPALSTCGTAPGLCVGAEGLPTATGRRGPGTPCLGAHAWAHTLFARPLASGRGEGGRVRAGSLPPLAWAWLTAGRSWQPQTASRSYVSSAPASLSKDEDAGRFHSTKKGNFHEIFNLTENERPLAACENGWRCCLINRDRKMPTDYIRNGLLYVTENYLCFESSKSGSSKRNKVIKLVDITDIQKYKVLSVLPGSGMGIAVSTPSTQKPLVFGAMVHRDEAFETIFSQYVKITAAAASGSDS